MRSTDERRKKAGGAARVTETAADAVVQQTERNVVAKRLTTLAQKIREVIFVNHIGRLIENNFIQWVFFTITNKVILNLNKE